MLYDKFKGRLWILGWYHKAFYGFNQVIGSVKFTPCNNWFRSAAFDIANIIYFLAKRVTLMRRSTVLSLDLQLMFSVVTSSSI